MSKYFVSVGIVVGLVLIWVLVQHLWRKSFTDYISDEDALADRSKCGNCHCSTACSLQNKQTLSH